MSALSRLIGGIANTITPAVAIAPLDPGTKFIATQIGSELGKKERQRKQAQEIENMPGQFPTGIPNVGGQVSGFAPVGTQNSGGQPSFVSGITDFFSGAGEVVKSAFSSGIPQLLGFGRPRTAVQQPAITTVTNVGAQESQGSGSIQAGMGSLLPTIVGAARGLLKSPVGQIGLGTGAGAALSFIGSDGQPMRMTRKMKAQARSLLNMTGGNLSMTANFLGISEEALVSLLLKRFRNDGPVVTKAALRKTKSTIRKLKNMCDMYDDLRPAARRRTPMRRKSSTTTLIKN
tara:strand:- start:71 stop:937 length:867 start_codon:yes stop_codon:yes gene_type:complete